jgi:hypothetical protein
MTLLPPFSGYENESRGEKSSQLDKGKGERVLGVRAGGVGVKLMETY